MPPNNEQHWSAEPSAQARHVQFCSCLCKTCYVFQKLSLALRTLSLSFVTNNSSLDSKAFLCFIAFSGSPTVVHHAFLFFDAKAWQQSQTDLFTYTTVSHCGHTFWTSRERQSQTSKFDGKTTIPRAPTHVITHLLLRMCYGEVYGNIAHQENGWLSHGKFIMLLTFRGVAADTSRWTPKSARRQNTVYTQASGFPYILFHSQNQISNYK